MARCELNTGQVEHPDKQQMLYVLLHPRELVFFDPVEGKEKIKQVQEHLAVCYPCVKVVQENVKFY